MESKQPTKLSDLYNQDMSGWITTQAHFLEKKHGLMGTFPAVVEKEVIVVLDKKLLQKVWEKIEKLSAQVTTITVIANPEKGIAFNLRSYSGDETESIRIFSEAEINQLYEKEESFNWAFGLIQVREEPVTEPSFA